MCRTWCRARLQPLAVRTPAGLADPFKAVQPGGWHHGALGKLERARGFRTNGVSGTVVALLSDDEVPMKVGE